MTDVILHHYDASPFAKKIRLIFGMKNLNWKSVEIPRVMPKPDLVALTGGYRRTPVLQKGADIFCDTVLIAKVINALSPEVDVYPSDQLATVNAMSQWGDTQLFQNAVGLVFQKDILIAMFGGNEKAMAAFAEDRSALNKDAPRRRIPASEAKVFIEQALDQINEQLSDDRPFLLGDYLTIADASVYHPLWFLQTKPIVNETLKPYANVNRWMERLNAFGEGESSVLTSEAAIQVARQSEPNSLSATCMLEGFAIGDQVSVMPADYGFDPVLGTLRYADEHKVAIARTDERAGEVVVHFPRINYLVKHLK
ncbi:glutathione S-transferase family protein [Aurantivibrio plasticivorans]